MSVEDEQARFQAEGRPGEIFGEYLMRTADRREAEFQARRCVDYAKDNARLRALIESTQDRNGHMRSHGFDFCPWCGETEGIDSDHSPECPAFKVNLFTGKTVVR